MNYFIGGNQSRNEVHMGEPPIWDQVKKWELLSGRGQLFDWDNEVACQLRPEDRLVGANQYLMRLGALSALNAVGEEFVNEVEKICGFDSLTEWGRQTKWLAELFQRYYPSNGSGCGSCSILTHRRTSSLRHEENHDVTITQKESTPIWIQSPETIQVPFRGVPFHSSVFASPTDLTTGIGNWAEMSVRREIRVRSLGLYEPYVERWYCRVPPEVRFSNSAEYQRLSKGRVPAVTDGAYGTDQKPMRFRNTVLLSLEKYHQTSRDPKKWRHEVLVIELDPVTALVITVRHIRMPLVAAILCASAVELVQLNKFFSRIR